MTKLCHNKHPWPNINATWAWLSAGGRDILLWLCQPGQGCAAGQEWRGRELGHLPSEVSRSSSRLPTYFQWCHPFPRILHVLRPFLLRLRRPCPDVLHLPGHVPEVGSHTGCGACSEDGVAPHSYSRELGRQDQTQPSHRGSTPSTGADSA